IGKRNSLIN
ncbi:ATP-dependent metallopeptidase HflB family protein, partial [Chlamydia psittaci 10_743_SC13]